MRVLVLMRGPMGSGKSTAIKNAGLENYTLSADDYRLKVTSPALDIEGNFHISSSRDKIVWESLMRDLEIRMQNGDFTIVDATHTTVKLINKYKQLADTYGYKIFYIQMDTSLEECIRRNAERDEYKRVPEDAIYRSYELTHSVNPSKVFTRINHFDEVTNFYTVDLTNRYDEIKIVGDIHGSYTVLMEAVSKTIDNDRILHIFLGDYCDRGAEERKTLDWLLDNCERKNVIFLEGNHDINLRRWSFGLDRDLLSRTFRYKTLPEYMHDFNEHYNGIINKCNERIREAVMTGTQCTPEELYTHLENRLTVNEYAKEWRDELIRAKEEKVAGYDTLLKRVRNLCRKMRQAYAFTFHGKRYLCTHGGLTAVPNLALLSANQLIKGVGGYECDLAEIYKENFLLGRCQDYIQVHGHRQVTSNEYSKSLESEVEFGGHLSTLEIKVDNGGAIETVIRYKNNVFLERRVEDEVMMSEESKYNYPDKELTTLLNSRYMTVKRMDEPHDNILSASFKEMIFRKSIWNKLTIKARGLFIDKDSGEILARGYNKTFNYEQVKATSKRELEKTLKFPVKAYEKYNGFLGIISRRNGEWLICSKSTTSGQFVEYIKEAFNQESDVFKQQLASIIDRENCTLLFEVIHPEDEHMVDYHGHSHLYLLDVVPNALDVSIKHPDKHYVHIDHEYSQSILDEIDYTHAIMTSRKVCLTTSLNSIQEIEDYMKGLDTLDNLEGVMFEDQNGFVFKYKTKLYTDWKRRRGLLSTFKKHCIRAGVRFPMQYTRDETDVKFVNFLSTLPKEMFDNEYNERGEVINQNGIVKFKKLFLQS